MRTRTLLLILPLILTAAKADPACRQPVPDHVFEQHYYRIADTRHEGAQLEMARQFVRNYCVSTWQVGDLMDLMYHDGNRLELARFAYRSVVDPGNYLMLTDLLNHPGNREELYRFVQSQRPRQDLHRGGPPPHAPAWGRRKKDRDRNYSHGHGHGHDREDDRWEDDRRYQQRPVYEPAPVRGFPQIIIEVRRESRCDRQCAMAMQYASAHRLSTREVMSLMREIREDQMRMQFARDAYPYVTDPGNYRQVVGVLQTTRCQSEMRAWLNR